MTRLVSRITADVDALGHAGQRSGLALDEVAPAAVKHRFVTASEGCVRVAIHVCASEEWGVVDTNADAVRSLRSRRQAGGGVARRELT